MKTRLLNLTGISASVTRARAKQLFAAMKRAVAAVPENADCCAGNARRYGPRRRRGSPAPGSGIECRIRAFSLHQTHQMKPKRIQLRRTKGWRMPPNTVKVDRTSKIFGNPFRVCSGMTADEAVTRYTAWISDIHGEGCDVIPLARRHLRGKNLGCWCKIGTPCHANVLLELANAPSIVWDRGARDIARKAIVDAVGTKGTK